jgi:Cof subfamily protein (haloacid dehalogenase superfamily)
MDYKLVLSDIDGTLLNDGGQLLSPTEKSIHDLVESGILFSTVSARTVSHANNAIPGLVEFCAARAYCNGAYIEAANGVVLNDKPMEDEEVAFLAHQLAQSQASFGCIGKNAVVAKIIDPKAAMGIRKHHGTYNEKMKLEGSELETYLIAAEAEDLRAVVEIASRQLTEIEISTIPVSRTSGLQNAFFQKRGTNKGGALRIIAKHYDITLSKTVAFGDNDLNDGSMIQAAGFGVAMKNADEVLRSKARHVTDKDNNHDGLGDYLRAMFSL